jgi:hypothetical protein
MDQTITPTIAPAPVVAAWPVSRQFFKEAVEIYKKRFKNLIVISLVPIALVFIFGLVVGFAAVLLKDRGSVPLIILIVALALVAIYVSVWGFAAMIHYIIGDEQSTVRQAFDAAGQDVFPLIITGILTGLAVFGGIILLIIPGILFAFWFSQGYFIVIAEKISGPAALKLSKSYVKGNIWEIFKKGFYLGIISIGLGILVGIVFGILDGIFHAQFLANVGGLLFRLLWGPLATVYSYLIYKHLKTLKTGQA